MPKVLSRLPYGQEFKRCESFNFEEMVDGKEHDQYSWMGAAWAYGTRITDASPRTAGSPAAAASRAAARSRAAVHTFPNDDGDVR